MTDTLVIASGAALQYAKKEVDALRDSGLDVEILEGDRATKEEFLRAVRVQEWLRLWFIAHGTPAGVQLTDGLLTTAQITQYARYADVEFIFINTCESAQVARNIQQELDIVLVCTVTKIDDYIAYSTGALFATSLAKNDDYQIAYWRSKPGQNSEYLFLPETMPPTRSNASDDGRIISNRERIQQNSATLAESIARIAKIERIVDRLERNVFGDTDAGTGAVRLELKKLRTEVAGITTQLTSMQNTLDDQRDPTSIPAWQLRVAVGFGFLIALGALLNIFGTLGWIGSG